MHVSSQVFRYIVNNYTGMCLGDICNDAITLSKTMSLSMIVGVGIGQKLYGFQTIFNSKQ